MISCVSFCAKKLLFFCFFRVGSVTDDSPSAPNRSSLLLAFF